MKYTEKGRILQFKIYPRIAANGQLRNVESAVLNIASMY